MVSSPPFFRQRNYGAEGQIGLEDTVEQWVERLQVVMAEVHRVLVPTGSAWVDLGDTYSRHLHSGAPAKSLLLAPERFALAMVAAGWIVRSRVYLGQTESDARLRQRSAEQHLRHRFSLGEATQVLL